MSKHTLSSGRVVIDSYRGPDGRPKYLEIFDPRLGARRLIYGPWWDGHDRSKSLGPAASIDDIPDLIEYFMEVYQMHWTPDPRNGRLVVFGLAFPYAKPAVGDQLQDIATQQIFTVQHVPPGIGRVDWNLSVLLDDAPAAGSALRWIGPARARNLVDFYAEDGRPESPVEGEATDGDVGTAYRKVKGPTVTYLMTRQEPCSIDGKPFGASPRLKPSLRETYSMPGEPQRAVQISGWQMDNLFKFSCLHPRARVAHSLAEWFKACISRNEPSLRANGIPHLYFYGQKSLPRSGRAGDDVAEREVYFYFQTEELEVQELSTIRVINLYARSASDIDNLGLPGLEDPGEGYLGLNPWASVYDESGNPVFVQSEIQDFGQTGVP